MKLLFAPEKEAEMSAMFGRVQSPGARDRGRLSSRWRGRRRLSFR